MIIPKVSIKNILSIDSNNEVNVKEQEKASSSSTKDYNKEECLSNLWIELISCLFDENPKISLKDLMAKKYSNNSYVERATSDELRKRSNSSSSNDSEISNNSTNSSTSKRNIFKIGRSSSPNNH